MQIISKLKDIKITAIIIAVILVLTFLILIFFPFSVGLNEIEIKSGSNLSSIARDLKSQGIIKSRLLFIFYITALGKDNSLKAGRYNFSGRVSSHEIAIALTGGLSEHDDIQVTIPEGMNIWEVDQVLSKAGLITEGQLAKNYIHKEGHLFPDTYRFDNDASIEDIVNKMEANYYEKGKTRSDITLITASILEKEAKTKEDMAIVAGIIQNRLDAGMLLQIDATVTYGACLREFNRTGKLCDVTIIGPAIEIPKDGPYNTYTRKGLPPTAISNPGVKAIMAASNPTKTDYLYYLSTRDGSQIIYSKTSAEHLANRKKYLGF